MKTYLVGGAVRDALMGKEPKDRDYVVVGSTPEEMLAAGFTQVGADFPVFLHPVTGDEYALARTERKVGKGYNGFKTDSSPTVTLKEDLARRDLTVNAMALPADGAWRYGKSDWDGTVSTVDLVDPFNGLADLRRGVLRHVTDEGFVEDPVRVLRGARFMARFGPDWTVADETLHLMRKMVARGMLDELTPERVWKEMSRALTEAHPRLFFDTLRDVDALPVLFPEIHRLTECKEHPKWHPEGDSYEHTMLVLTQAALQFPGDLEAAFCALVHDFGKGAIPDEEHPRFLGHDAKGVPLVDEFSNKWTVPADLRETAKVATRYHMRGHLFTTMTPKAYVKMFVTMDARRKPNRVTALYKTVRMDTRGRLGHENDPLDDKQMLLDTFAAFKSVTFAAAGCEVGMNPQRILQMMQAAQREAVAQVLKSTKE